MNIPQAAVDAAVSPLLKDYWIPGVGNLTAPQWRTVAATALEAAMPHLRRQVASEIRAEAAKRAGTAGWDTAFHNLGLVTAARIAENGPGQ